MLPSAVLPIAKARKIPLFQTTEAGPDVDNYMIKLMPDSAGVVAELARQYVKKYPKLAVIGSTMASNTSERGNFPLIRESYTAQGGNIVMLEEIPPDTTDFRTVIERIRRSGADAVTPFLFPASQLAAFLKQGDALRLWKDVPLAGNFFFEFLLKELVVLYPDIKKLNGLQSANLAQSTSEKFKAEYQARFNEPAPQFADYAYDAFSIIQRCGLEQSCYRNPFQGVSGMVEFDPKTDRRVGQFIGLTLQDGVFVVNKAP